jgi:hypothetical protein
MDRVKRAESVKMNRMKMTPVDPGRPGRDGPRLAGRNTAVVEAYGRDAGVSCCIHADIREASFLVSIVIHVMVNLWPYRRAATLILSEVFQRLTGTSRFGRQKSPYPSLTCAHWVSPLLRSYASS